MRAQLPSSEELQEAIAREEARLVRLDGERRLAQSRLDALREELAALGPFRPVDCFP